MKKYLRVCVDIPWTIVHALQIVFGMNGRLNKAIDSTELAIIRLDMEVKALDTEIKMAAAGGKWKEVSGVTIQVKKDETDAG